MSEYDNPVYHDPAADQSYGAGVKRQRGEEPTKEETEAETREILGKYLKIFEGKSEKLMEILLDM